MKFLFVILMLASPTIYAQDNCPGSCWRDGCCEPQPRPRPRPNDCRAKNDEELCVKIPVQEALALIAAKSETRVFISPDQRQALRCD